MTVVGLRFQELEETKRKNRASEGLESRRIAETTRSNLANEAETHRSNVAREGETTRHNIATERQNIAELEEAKRHNIASEFETNRSNVAREKETERSNKAKESETHRSNVAKENETYRSNVAKEEETKRSNIAKETETKRSNLANEALKSRDLDRQDLREARNWSKDQAYYNLDARDVRRKELDSESQRARNKYQNTKDLSDSKLKDTQRFTTAFKTGADTASSIISLAGRFLGF